MIPSSAEEIFKKGNEIANPFSATIKISDYVTYEECIGELAKKLSNKEAVKKQQQLGAMRQSCEWVVKTLARVKSSSDEFVGPYSELIADKDKIKHIDLEVFLSKGKELIDNGHLEPNKCPFCGVHIDLQHISQEVAKRIHQFKEIKAKFEGTRELKNKCLSDTTETIRLLGELADRCKEVGNNEALIEEAKVVIGLLKAYGPTVEDCFKVYAPIPTNLEGAEVKAKLQDKLKGKATSLSDDINALELTGEEQMLFGAISSLQELKRAFDSYQKNLKIKELFEKQIKTLAKIKEQFIQVQAQSLQDVLDIMSEDIKRYYLELHPKENIDAIRLRILGSEGIEFEYSFHGKITYPPKKYLSESHLNSLGLALFLASARLFNKENQFFVLDDVVTSFDAGHRLRLLRLLKKEFSDWQILLLTHQRHWFQIIKKELGSVGWLLREVIWTEENGVQMKGVPEDTRELITFKRSQGLDVGNDVRTLLEELLKAICHDLEVKIAFRFNDRNEQRMPGELLPALRATLKVKSPLLNGDPIWNNLETSNLLGTIGSHDNPQEISPGDIDVALEDIAKLEKLFRCVKCRQFLMRDSYVDAEKKLLCKCGALTLAWKD
jgi:hypothetical protein